MHSGTVSAKSFEMFSLNQGLLARCVEAVKEGEALARKSGQIQSFEVFRNGFRMNLVIGRIMIIPPSVCENREDFPVALLYGALIREIRPEDLSDLMSAKIGDSEFDEYDTADMQEIKEKLFQVPGSKKYGCLVCFLPSWCSPREYVFFKYTKDETALANALRHLVFAAYYDPRLSSAFDHIMQDTDTVNHGTELDVTNITPKLNYPGVAEGVVNAYPKLESADDIPASQDRPTGPGSKKQKKASRTFKTVLAADSVNAIQQDELGRGEVDVLDAVTEAAEAAVLKQRETPSDAAADDNAAMKQSADAGLQRRPDYGKRAHQVPCPYCKHTEPSEDDLEDHIARAHKNASAKKAQSGHTLMPGCHGADKGAQSHKSCPGVVDGTHCDCECHELREQEGVIAGKEAGDVKGLGEMKVKMKLNLDELPEKAQEKVVSGATSAAKNVGEAADTKAASKDDEYEKEVEKEDRRGYPEGFKPKKKAVDLGCECGDPGCPMHPGSEKCRSKDIAGTAFRIDMDDLTGTQMCSGCLEDAADSGVFRIEDIGGEEREDEREFSLMSSKTAAGLLDNKGLFRELEPADEKKFRDWARQNDPPDITKWDMYHPVCRQEWEARGIKPHDEKQLPLAPQASEKTASFKLTAAFIRTAAITVSRGEDSQGPHTIVTMDGRDYVLRGADSNAFRREYNAIVKPPAQVNALVTKYMDKLQPYSKKQAPAVNKPAVKAPSVADEMEQAKAWAKPPSVADEMAGAKSWANQLQPATASVKTAENVICECGHQKSVHHAKCSSKGCGCKSYKQAKSEAQKDSEKTAAAIISGGHKPGCQCGFCKNKGKLPGMKDKDKKDEKKEEKKEEKKASRSKIAHTDEQEALLADGSAEECGECGAVSAYSWDDANYCEDCSKPFGLVIPEDQRVYHIGAASGFEWECGKCGTSWTPHDSPLTAEVYTHVNPDDWDREASSERTVQARKAHETKLAKLRRTHVADESDDILSGILQPMDRISDEVKVEDGDGRPELSKGEAETLSGSTNPKVGASKTGAAYDVFIRGVWVNRVFDADPDPEEVKRSLINHDGYSTEIEVRRGSKTIPQGNPWTEEEIQQGRRGRLASEKKACELEIPESEPATGVYTKNTEGKDPVGKAKADIPQGSKPVNMSELEKQAALWLGEDIEEPIRVNAAAQMRCPQCGGTASKINNEDPYSCAKCGWQSEHKAASIRKHASDRIIATLDDLLTAEPFDPENEDRPDSSLMEGLVSGPLKGGTHETNETAGPANKVAESDYICPACKSGVCGECKNINPSGNAPCTHGCHANQGKKTADLQESGLKSDAEVIPNKTEPAKLDATQLGGPQNSSERPNVNAVREQVEVADEMDKHETIEEKETEVAAAHEKEEAEATAAPEEAGTEVIDAPAGSGKIVININASQWLKAHGLSSQPSKDGVERCGECGRPMTSGLGGPEIPHHIADDGDIDYDLDADHLPLAESLYEIEAGKDYQVEPITSGMSNGNFGGTGATGTAGAPDLARQGSDEIAITADGLAQQQMDFFTGPVKDLAKSIPSHVPSLSGGGAEGAEGAELADVAMIASKTADRALPRVTTPSKDYNGWHNWETWHTALLIDNDQTMQQTQRNLALRAIREAKGQPVNIDKLADQFSKVLRKAYTETKAFYESNAREFGGGWAENPFEEVNWHEIAENAVSDEEMNAEYEAKQMPHEEFKGQLPADGLTEEEIKSEHEKRSSKTAAVDMNTQIEKDTHMVRPLEIGDKVVHTLSGTRGKVIEVSEVGGRPTISIQTPQGKILSRLSRQEFRLDSSPVMASKTAGFNFWFPGQVLREFYPEVQHEVVDYPNADNKPMIQDIDLSPEKMGTTEKEAASSGVCVRCGHRLDLPENQPSEAEKANKAFADRYCKRCLSGRPTAEPIVEKTSDAKEAGTPNYTSTDPGAIGIGRDGKPQVLEGAPLRKENDIRGPMFSEEFYANYPGVPGKYMAMASDFSKSAAASQEQKEMLSDFLKKVVGEIAVTFAAAFKVTSRPIQLDKIPGRGEVNLVNVENSVNNWPFYAGEVGGRIKYLLEQMNDSDIQDAINDAWAQAAVWHSGSGSGNFTYEIFVRAQAIDTDSMVMKYEFVTGTKGD